MLALITELDHIDVVLPLTMKFIKWQSLLWLALIAICKREDLV